MLVVDSNEQAAALNRVLLPGSKAIPVLGPTMGLSFDSYLLLLSPSAVVSATRRTMIHRWIEDSVKTRMRPERKALP